MKIGRTKLLLGAALAATIALTGCGSTTNSDSSFQSGLPVVPTSDAIKVGIFDCAQCHWQQGAEYMVSRHSNTEETGGTCARCHDPSGAGAQILAAFGKEAVGAVGCEDCHGGGQYHWGVGPIPNPKPGQSTCTANCHPLINDGTFQHAVRWTAIDAAGKPAIKFNLATKQPVYSSSGSLTYWAATDANNSTNGTNTLAGYAFGSFSDIQFNTTNATVSSYKFATRGTRFIYDTHYTKDTDSVSVSTSSATTSSPNKIAGYVLNANDTGECVKCHDVHNTDLVRNREWAKSRHGGRLLTLKELADEKGVTKASLVDPTKTPDKQTVPVAAPSATPTVTYPPSNLAAGAFDWDAGLGGTTWAHYNWDDNASRGACQKCHTATGIKNYLSANLSAGSWDPTKYDATKNDFSHLKNWTASGGSPQQNEMLYCWGCHVDGLGNLRNPGNIKPDYGLTKFDGSADASAYPSTGNAGASNVCGACHSGRGNQDTAKTAFAAINNPIPSGSSAYTAKVKTADMAFAWPSKGPGAFTATQTHYLNAAATVFQNKLHPGYEYAGRNYNNPDKFNNEGHVTIGIFGGATTGPCVPCHMGPDNSHEFSSVTRGSTPEQEIITFEEVCLNCHGKGDIDAMDETIREEAATGYEASLSILGKLLKSKGALFDGANYPYFTECYISGESAGQVVKYRRSTDTADQLMQFRSWSNWTTWGSDPSIAVANRADRVNYTMTNTAPAADGTVTITFTYKTTGSNADEGFAGAAHNMNYLTREPGSYTHNPVYTKRLLFDSINYMLNHSTSGPTINLSAFGAEGATAAAWLNTNRQGSVVARPGDTYSFID